MGHRSPKGYPPPPGPINILTRGGYASKLFLEDKIDLEEFEHRLELLFAFGKADDPYIIDAGPAGFQRPTKDMH